MVEEIVPTEEFSKEEIPMPVEEKKEKRWLKPLLFSTLGIVFAAGLVFSSYKLGQRKIQPSPQPIPTPIVESIPTPDPTADWEIYINNVYSFQFRYPKGWNYGSPPGFSETIFFSPSKISFPQDSEGPITPVKISIKGKTTIEEEVNRFKNAYQYKDFKDETIVIGGVKAREISGVVESESYVMGKFTVEVFIPREDTIIHLGYLGTDEMNVETFNLMLSTFGFLE